MKLSQTKLARMISSLWEAQIQTDCQCTLSLYGDGETAQPESTHRFQSGCRRPLGKLLLLAAGIGLLFAVLRGICRLFSHC